MKRQGQGVRARKKCWGCLKDVDDVLGVVPGVPLLLGSADFVGVICHAVPSRPESGSCSGRGCRAQIGPCDGFGLEAAGSWLGGVCRPPIVCTRECLGNGRAQGWVLWFTLPTHLGLPSPTACNAPAVLNPLWTTPAVTCGRRSGRLGAGLGLGLGLEADTSRRGPGTKSRQTQESR